MAKRHLIIGCGPAGLSALGKIRGISPGDEVKLISKEVYLPYSPTVLPSLISGRISEANIWLKDEQYFQRIQVTFSRGKEVVRVLPDEKRVVYQDKSTDEYDNLLIASGSAPIKPPIAGLEKVGFFGFHTLEDYRRLLAAPRREEIAILGGGLVGTELAVALYEAGHRVKLIEKEQQILPLYFDRLAATFIEDILRKQGIELFCSREVIEVRKQKGQLELVCASGEIIRADLLITCIGVGANIAFLSGSGIKLNRGIVVDNQMRTSVEDVFAAGDVAEAPDFFSAEPGINAIVPVAIDQGEVAGANMVGEAASFKGWIPMNVFSLHDNVASSIGLSMAHGERLEDKDDHRTAFKRLVFQDGRLIGAMFVNVDVDPGVIRYLIENKTDITPYKEMLLERTGDTSRWLMLKAEKEKSELMQA